MSVPASKYQRLPGRSFGFAQRGSLWLGDDHILAVSNIFTGESYRRFFFRDIQAVVVRRTVRRTIYNAVLLALTAINLLPLFFLAASDVGDRDFAFLALGSVLWGALALVNTLRGPTGETRLRTAVQEEVIAPLGRIRTAERVVGMLRPRILAAQALPAAVQPQTTGSNAAAASEPAPGISPEITPAAGGGQA